jgi:polyphosphate kinase
MEAALDPKVTSISITLYRLHNSQIISSHKCGPKTESYRTN